MSAFFAYMSRLKLISRWGLMHATLPENDAEHSLQVAMMAHVLATLAKERYSRDVDPAQVAVLAMYHDVSEIFTGDLPTPVKHHDAQLKSAYHELESAAQQRLTDTLPDIVRPAMASVLRPDESSYAWRLVKAADRISAWSKCMEELRCGNREFASAAENIRASIDAIGLPEVGDFMAEFADAFSMTLDELEAMG